MTAKELVEKHDSMTAVYEAYLDGDLTDEEQVCFQSWASPQFLLAISINRVAKAIQSLGPI